MNSRPDNFAKTFSETGVGTNAGVSVDHAAETDKRHLVTGIQCSGDAAAVVTVESPAGTILYRKRFAGAFTMNEQFPVPLKGARGEIVRVKVSASTANCEANLQGYTVL